MVYINEEKLNSIHLNNDNFYVVMDFDMTITTPDSDNCWSMLENPDFMNPNFKRDARNLFNSYYPYEIDYTLDFEIKLKYMDEWYKRNMDLFYEYGLTYNILLNCVKHSNVHFRKNFKTFLEFLYQNNIPLIILSAGIGNVIVEVLKLNNCLYNNIHIISNFIDFENNKMKPFENEMIHSCNKCISNLPEDFKNKISKKDYILLFGDLIEDLSMVPKEDLHRTLSFGFLDKKIDDNAKFYKNNFDIVLTNNASYDDVQSILNKIKND